MSYPQFAGTVAAAAASDPPSSCCAPAPDTLLRMYSARRWSARSVSATDSVASEDVREGAHGPCLCVSRSTADVPFRRGAAENLTESHPSRRISTRARHDELKLNNR